MKPQELARLTVETYIKTGTKPLAPKNLEGVSISRAGVFVSIKTEIGDLRGCIGTIAPVEESVAQEIIYNAISSATKDSRFSPVGAFELSELKYSVDILHMSEKVGSLEELDPKNYGIIVASESGRQGLLLPNLEGVDMVEQQIAICKRKGGISDREKFYIRKFKVDRYSE